MLTGGERLEELSKQMGHNDPSMTARIYAGLLDGLEVSKFGENAARMIGGSG